ncbi:7TM-DISM domain-containing protein [Azorhizophilus paspali]|uniref:7TM-DISM domain-containing protein n=1 Tax=Azorhizophilus paspali TaxID=69963 RepID=UPI00364514C5
MRLAPGEQRSLFFRAQSSGTLTLDAQIWESAAFARHSRLTLMLQSGYIAMLAALCSYNLLLFFALRERNFLLYVLFAASLGGGMLAQSGLGAQYLWSDGSELDNRALPFFLGLALALGTLFTREFLDTRHALPRWHKLLGQACAVYFGMTLGSLLLPVDRALQTLSVISIVGILLLLACGLAGLLRRSPGARIFVLAELALMAGVVLMSLRNFTLLPSNLVTANSVQFGSALEMLLLSFGLAARLGSSSASSWRPARPSCAASRKPSGPCRNRSVCSNSEWPSAPPPSPRPTRASAPSPCRTRSPAWPTASA